MRPMGSGIVVAVVLACASNKSERQTAPVAGPPANASARAATPAPPAAPTAGNSAAMTAAEAAEKAHEEWVRTHQGGAAPRR